MTLKEKQDKAIDIATRWQNCQLTLGEYSLVNWPETAALLVSRIEDLKREVVVARDFANKVQEQAAHIRDSAAA